LSAAAGNHNKNIIIANRRYPEYSWILPNCWRSVAKNGASDLHLSAGLPPMIRVDGDVRRINLPPMEHKEVHRLVYDIMNDKQRKDYEEFLETDFSFEVPGVARFRVNAFNQNRGAGAVFRTIPSKV
jgi:twitching motility protein PilT